MIIVKFKNVGKDNKSWIAIKKKGELNYNWLYNQILKKQILIDGDIEFHEIGIITIDSIEIGQFETINKKGNKNEI